MDFFSATFWTNLFICHDKAPWIWLLQIYFISVQYDYGFRPFAQCIFWQSDLKSGTIYKQNIYRFSILYIYALCLQ